METYFKNLTREEVTRERLLEDLAALVHDADELVKTTGGTLAGKSRQELMAALERVKASCRRIEAGTAARLADADKIIREHPYQSIGFAFGVGLLLGVLVNRK